MLENYQSDFLLFESQLLENRYDHLKERDRLSFMKHAKLFSFLILFGAGPFLIQNGLSTQLVQLWGLGGLWLVVTILVYFDRDFRAYGLHLKERIFCLYQLAVIREVCLSEVEEYRNRTLLPVGHLHRPSGGHSGFPERISSGQIRVACYFFKFLGLFPILYAMVFAYGLTYPQGVIDKMNPPALSVVFMLAFLPSAWLYVSVMRCLDLQKTVFEARRISSDNPWPAFDRSSLRRAAAAAKGRLQHKLLLVLMTILSATCTIVFLLDRLQLASEELLGPRLLITLAAAQVVIWITYFFGSDRYMTNILKEMRLIYAVDTGNRSASNHAVNEGIRGVQ